MIKKSWVLLFVSFSLFAPNEQTIETEGNNSLEHDQDVLRQEEVLFEARENNMNQPSSSRSSSGRSLISKVSTPIITQGVIPATPGIGFTINVPRPVLVVDRTIGNLKAETVLENRVTTLIDALLQVKSADDFIGVRNAFNSYKGSYEVQKGELQESMRSAFEPATVLYNAIEAMSNSIHVKDLADILSAATASDSLVTEITSFESTLKANARKRLHAGMRDFVTTINQMRSLYMLLELQGSLLEAQANQAVSAVSRGIKPVDVGLNPAMYDAYVGQWNNQYIALQDFFSHFKELQNMFATVAAALKNQEYIDISGDVGAQILQCQQFKNAYDQYIRLYYGLGLSDLSVRSRQHVFDFILDMYDTLQNQIIIAQKRLEAQPSWKKLIQNILSFVGLRPSISKQLQTLSVARLGEMQQQLYTLSNFQGSLTPDAIATLAGIKADMLALDALATIPLDTISVNDFKTYLGWDTTTQKVDSRLSDIFSPTVNTPQAILNQYTIKLSGAGVPLLKAEYVQNFIKYRLLGMSDATDAFIMEERCRALFKPDNTLWDSVTDQYGTKEKLQNFLSNIIGWDIQDQVIKPAVHFDPGDSRDSGNVDYSMYDRWYDLTQTIKVWADQDVTRLNVLVGKKMQPDAVIQETDLALLRSYLQLRAAIAQTSGKADLVTIKSLAHMCDSLFGQTIIVQALRTSQPISLKVFKPSAQRMKPFRLSIAGMYAAIEASCTITLAQQDKSQIHQGLSSKQEGKFVPYGAQVIFITNPVSDEGHSGGHHSGDSQAEKCYDEHHKEIDCNENNNK